MRFAYILCARKMYTNACVLSIERHKGIGLYLCVVGGGCVRCLSVET